MGTIQPILKIINISYNFVPDKFSFLNNTDSQNETFIFPQDLVNYSCVCDTEENVFYHIKVKKNTHFLHSHRNYTSVNRNPNT